MKNNILSHETLAVITAGLVTLAIILCMSITLSSCSTTSKTGIGHQIAPMVKNYDVKKIKLQANSNVSPWAWEEVAIQQEKH